MSLSLAQTLTAIVPNMFAFFQGIGGTSPYTYSVLAGGAGGTINASTGKYTAPPSMSLDPKKIYDTVQVTDAVAATFTAQILVGTPLFLLCDIIQSQLNIPVGRVYLWDQKIFQPTDSGLYVAISMPHCKPFGNTFVTDGSGSGLNSVQTLNMMATVDIDIISRDSSARDRKEEVVLAFNSIYSQSQQEVNSFYIGKLPPGAQFVNLSQVDGAAIPYRYKISVNMQYAFTKTTAVPYFDTFSVEQVNTNS